MTDDEGSDGDNEFDDGLPGGMTYGDFLRVQLDVLVQQDGDFLLRILVDVVNQTDISFDITLTVGGALVCGQLVSGETYFDELASLIDEQAGEQGIVLSIPFRMLRDDYLARGRLASLAAELARENEEADRDKSASRLPVFIHLRDAAVWHGATDSNIGFWRGRIAEIQGWTPGRFRRRST